MQHPCRPRRLPAHRVLLLALVVLGSTAAPASDRNHRADQTPRPLAGSGGTTTTLTSGPNPSHRNQPVFFTATVSGQVPTGTVTFSEGSTVLCGGPVSLRQDGTALCTILTFAAGTHEVVAAYSGDQGNSPSASNLVSQSVGSLLWTTMTFSSQCAFLPVDPGEPFTYSIRLNGGSAPQGDVVFSDGSKTLCTVPLVDRIATCTTDELEATGDEPLTSLALRATYLGDGINAPADSGSFPARVRNPLVFIFRDDFDYSDTCPTQL